MAAIDITRDGPEGQKRPDGQERDRLHRVLAARRLASRPMGTFQVDGLLNGWSADNGRWNIDLDGTTASVLTVRAAQTTATAAVRSGYKLTTVDFSNPASPQQLGDARHRARRAGPPTARFSQQADVPLAARGRVVAERPAAAHARRDLRPLEPGHAGARRLDEPQRRRLALHAAWAPTASSRSATSTGTATRRARSRSVRSTCPTRRQPTVIGTSTFGDGWAWTPAAEHLQGVHRRDDSKKPRASCPSAAGATRSTSTTNGVQLDRVRHRRALTSKRHGALEGLGRARRLREEPPRLAQRPGASASIDYAEPQQSEGRHGDHARAQRRHRPAARRHDRRSSRPTGGATTTTTSELRVLPIANAEETSPTPEREVGRRSTASTPAVFQQRRPRVRRHRRGASARRSPATATQRPERTVERDAPQSRSSTSSNGGATLEGSLDLPHAETDGYGGWGWGGCYYWDWYDGSNVGAGRRRRARLPPLYARLRYDPNTGDRIRARPRHALRRRPLEPGRAQASPRPTVTTDADAWWGNMQVVGNTLYTTHYEWKSKPIANPDPNGPTQIYWVRYYLDQIDLSDRAHPKVGQRINVPGMLVGASEHRLVAPLLRRLPLGRRLRQRAEDEIAVAKINSGKAYLQSSTRSTARSATSFVRGTTRRT